MMLPSKVRHFYYGMENSLFLHNPRHKSSQHFPRQEPPHLCGRIVRLPINNEAISFRQGVEGGLDDLFSCPHFPEGDVSGRFKE